MARLKRKKPSGMYTIYKELLERLPRTYPQPSLIVHDSLIEMRDYFWYAEKELPDDPGYPPFAFCDGINNTIHVSLQMNKESRENMIKIYLHEIGHLYAFKKYGEKDKRWMTLKRPKNLQIVLLLDGYLN